MSSFLVNINFILIYLGLVINLNSTSGSNGDYINNLRSKQATATVFFDVTDNKHLLDETESNIQFIASGQGNIGQSEAEPNIILYEHNQLDVGRGQVQ